MYVKNSHVYLDLEIQQWKNHLGDHHFQEGKDCHEGTLLETSINAGFQGLVNRWDKYLNVQI